MSGEPRPGGRASTESIMYRPTRRSVEVVTPAFRSVAQTDGNPNGGCRRGPPRMPQQAHPRFGRRAAALLAVTRHAAADDVFPVLSAALGDRDDMIEGQLAGGKLVAAVLALVVVARVDVRPRKWHVIEATLDLDVTEQA